MRLLDQLRQDATYALRSLGREPVLVAGIIVTFALAIGANAAMFGLVARLLLAPPPGVHDARHVARVKLVLTGGNGEVYEVGTTSYPAFRAVKDVDRVFSTVAAVRSESLVVGRGADLREASVLEVTGDYFRVLGAQPLAGRFLTADDDELPTGSNAVVLGHAYWRRQFAGENVLGRELVVDGQPFTVVGVARPGFNGDGLSQVDLYLPLSAALRKQEGPWWSETRFNLVTILGRLRDGVVAGPAVAQPLMSALRPIVGDDDTFVSVALEPLLPDNTGRATTQARTALWLAGVAAIVLLIATANVATLLLLRALRRRREIAVRVALGIGSGRLARQLLTESLLLALAGGALGLLIARWIADVIRVTLLPELAASESLIDPRVLTTTVGSALVVGVLAGCSPLVQAVRRNVADDLRGAAAQGRAGRAGMRGLLVGIQVALCTMLLVGAGLFVRSLHLVQSQDLGFSTAHLLFVTLDFRDRLPIAERDAIHFETARRLESLPGVLGATPVQATPFGAHHIPPISVPGLAEPPSAGGQLPMLYAANPRYLRLMGVTLREGRLLTDRDGRGSPLVVLVNETMARSVWPGQSAVGKCIRIGFDPSIPPGPLAPPSLPCREIVGVVRDSRARSIRPVGNEARLMQYYVPFGQVPGPPMGESAEAHGLLIGITGVPERAAPAIQQAIQRAIATPVFARVQPYQDLLDPQIRPWRLGATLFTAFGTLALAIAAVGMFGVVSYVVTQRTREIGVRLALGGSRGTIGASVVRDAARLVGIGVVAGLLAALAAAPLMQSLLFETSPREWFVLAGAGGALLVVAVAAAALPAWRASRVSPLIALRAD